MTTKTHDSLSFPEPPPTKTTKQGNGQRIRALFVSVPFSGIEIYFRSLQRILSSRTDIETSWEFIGWEPDKDASRLPFLPDNWTLKASLTCRSRLRRLEREGREFDVVVFNSIVPTLGFRSLLHGTPMVITVDVTPAMLEDYNALYGRSGGVRAKALSWLSDTFHARATYRGSAEILAWSPLVKQSLINEYGIDPGKITLVPPGLDLKRWGGNPDAVVPPTGWKDTHPRLLFVGRNFLRKGGDTILQVASTPEFSTCEFHFVTSVNRPTDVPANVIFHNELEPQSEELIGLYRQSDVFIIPTKADFYPTNGCCEAMAMELPIITTDVGGMRLLVDEAQGGFVIPTGDSAALSERLRTLLADHTLRHRFGVRNRLYAEANFDINNKAQVMADVLFRATHGGSRSIPAHHGDHAQ